MKGKKLMAMLMAGSLLLAGLTGCGGSTAKGGGAAASADRCSLMHLLFQ